MLLAPVIADRKGEHLHVFEELRGNGFIRARIDGDSYELDRPAEARSASNKHTIEAVVDRLRVRDGRCSSALAESFETALRLADGVGSHRVHRRPKREGARFLRPLRLPVCGYSLTELEPRLFSFNNPAGACPSATGSASSSSSIPIAWSRIRISRSRKARSAAGTGATSTTSSMIQSLARALRVRRRGALRHAPEAHARGHSERQRRRARSSSATPIRRGGTAKRRAPLRGHRARTWSGAIAKPTPRRCARISRDTWHARAVPECGGTRLNRSRAPRIRRRHGAAAISRAAPCATRWPSSRELTLDGWRGEDRAPRSSRRSRDRLRFLMRRRARLSDARPQRRDALRRRGAAHPAREPDRLRARRRHVHPRRTFDRPAPARQPAPARHAARICAISAIR